MSTQDEKREDKEFQLEMLKVRLKRQAFWAQSTMVIALELSIFVSVSIAYLSHGLASGDLWLQYYAAFVIILGWVVFYLTLRIISSEKTEKAFDNLAEKDIQSIRDKFISTEKTTK